MSSRNQESISLTREALRTALIRLLADRDLDQVSVTSLCQRAGVSRMAFYRHYQSIQTLYHETYDYYFKQFFSQNAQFLYQNQEIAFWESIFIFLFDHQDTATILLGNKESAHFLAYLNQTLCDPIEDLEIRTALRGTIGFTFNIMTDWVNSGFQQSPQSLAAICQDLLSPRIGQAIQLPTFSHLLP